MFVPKSAKSAVSTPKAEETPQPHMTSAATSNTSVNTSATTNTGSQSRQSDNNLLDDGDVEEEEEDFDGLNPYAAVQSPASTSGNLPTLSSSYHSAHSGPSTAASQSNYDPQTPAFEPSYPVHGQARIPDEGHAGQQMQEYGYDSSSYAGEGHPMHTQGLDINNPYLNGGMPGMEMYSQGMHQAVGELRRTVRQTGC